MAYKNITQKKDGTLKAKIQVYGKDASTGEAKLFFKTILNTEGLSLAKFKKFVDKEALAFEEEINNASNTDNKDRLRVLTFSELMAEWKEEVHKHLSQTYYEKVCTTEERFNSYLKDNHLDTAPISEITVRDIQKFLDIFIGTKPMRLEVVKMIKPLPVSVSYRELARLDIINRCSSYKMKQGTNIDIKSAQAICDYHSLKFDDYFVKVETTQSYSKETIKGYRRILRTLFNEAIRYDWITKNPVCATKIGSSACNVSIKPVEEKEVFSMQEAKDFIKTLNKLPEEQNVNFKMMAKLLLLTGMRNAELHGLKWVDIDFEKKVVHIRRNRLYSPKIGCYEKEPKTKTSKRDIPLSDELIEDLKKYYQWFKMADEHFDERLDEYYVAVNIYREPEFPQCLGHWLRRFEDNNGFKRVTCHGLRHTYCSLLLANNVPIQTVSKNMGHSDSTITLKVYSHFIPETQDKVLATLNLLS